MWGKNMVKSHERNINFYVAIFDFLDEKSIEGNTVDFKKILENHKEKFQLNPFCIKKDLFVSIVKIDISNNILKILWRVGDKNTAAPMYWQPENDSIRNSDIKEKEVVGYSCHTIISLNKNNQNGYYLLNEKIPDFGRINLETALNNILKKIIIKGINYQNEPVSSGLKVSLYNLPTLQLEDILKKGTNIKIEAIADNTDLIDFEQGFITQKRNDVVTIRCDGPKIYKEPIKAFKRLIKKLKKENYNYGYIKYSENGKSKQSSIDFETFTENSMLNRVESVILEQPIKQIEKDFHDNLIRKMKTFLHQIEKKEKNV